MICDGCKKEVHSLTELTWENGDVRGRFCISCRNWLAKGHRDSPVVMIHSGRRVLGEDRGSRITRIYRNDATGEFYQLSRNVKQGDSAFFVAYGPAKSRAELDDAVSPIEVNGHKVWGPDLSWKKAERLFIKTLTLRPR